MSDQFLMENYLLVLKSTMEVYVHGTLESSNDKTRCLLKEGLNETLNSQVDTYDIMAVHGWYKTKNVGLKEINKVLKKVKKTNS